MASVRQAFKKFCLSVNCNFYLLEQCSLTGGKESSLAMSVFLIFAASSIFTNKVKLDLKKYLISSIL